MEPSPLPSFVTLKMKSMGRKFGKFGGERERMLIRDRQSALIPVHMKFDFLGSLEMLQLSEEYFDYFLLTIFYHILYNHRSNLNPCRTMLKENTRREKV